MLPVLLFSVCSYMANLINTLPRKMQPPFEDVEGLAKQTIIKYGIQSGGSTAQFFKNSSIPLYKIMWQYMEAQKPSVFVSSYAEGIDRVREERGRYAFLLESSANNYAQERKPCDTLKIGGDLNSIGYGIATQFGSEWKNEINLAVLALQERGELKNLENNWWYHRSSCDYIDRIEQVVPSLMDMDKIAGIFYILFGGMIVALFVAMIEYRCRSSHKRHEHTPRADPLMDDDEKQTS